MKVVCRHGHFAFYPEAPDDIGRFETLFKMVLKAERDYYTFEALAGLPRWSQILKTYGNLPAIKTFEGEHPWEVMKANRFVYSLTLELLVPLATAVGRANIFRSQFYDFCAASLIQPGSIVTGYKPGIILDYQGTIDFAGKILLTSEGFLGDE